MGTAQTLIERSLRLQKVISTGQTPSDTVLADSLEALNSMLDGWSAQRLTILALVAESNVLVVSTASYTIGSGATWNTVRPIEIRRAYVQSAEGIDYPVEIITRYRYNNIGDKTLEGQPSRLWYDDQNPTGTVYLYPTPDKAETLYINSVKPHTALATLATSFVYPPGYEEAVKYNLAIRLAAEFDTPVLPEIARIADEALTAIKNRNLRPIEARLDIPDENRDRYYNIKTDEF